ncbi:MAG: hypothetical protein AAFU79_01535 [Myxococcota bacterium]
MTLPDREVREGTTNSEGLLVMKGIASTRSCKVTLPELEEAG